MKSGVALLELVFAIVIMALAFSILPSVQKQVLESSKNSVNSVYINYIGYASSLLSRLPYNNSNLCRTQQKINSPLAQICLPASENWGIPYSGDFSIFNRPDQGTGAVDIALNNNIMNTKLIGSGTGNTKIEGITKPTLVDVYGKSYQADFSAIVHRIHNETRVKGFNCTNAPSSDALMKIGYNINIPFVLTKCNIQILSEKTAATLLQSQIYLGNVPRTESLYHRYVLKFSNNLYDSEVKKNLSKLLSLPMISANDSLDNCKI